VDRVPLCKKKPPPIVDMSTNGQLVFTDVDKITFKGVGNASNAVVDTLTGKIGVGTDSPEANLHVLGNSYVSTNLELGGTLIMGTVNVEAQHSLEAVTATGNITPLTIEFTNATTSLVASGNVVVTGNVTAGSFLGDGSALTALNAANIGSGTLPVARGGTGTTSSTGTGALVLQNAPSFTGDATFDTNTLKIDSTNNRVGIGTASPAKPLHIEHYGSQIGDFEGIRIANHATNLHATSRPAYELVVSDINAGTGLGNGKFSIGYRGNTTASRTDRLVIDNSGRVGVGTTIPGHPLDVQFTGDSGIRAKNSGTSHASVYIDSASGYSYLRFEEGGAAKFWLQSTPTGDLAFRPSGGGHVMDILNNGNVGIGTSTPYAKLHVNGGSGSIAIGWRKYFAYSDPNYGGGDLAGQSGYGWGTHSIYANESIITGNYFVSAQGAISSSDERIKKDIVDVEDGKALDIIRELKPKKYRYKDEINRGVEPVWGFIAQEVNDILPEAIKIDEECLPNIYEMANVSTSNVITFTNFDTSTLESNASVIKVYDTKDEEHLITLNKVIDEHTIRVEEDLSEWIGSLDETGNVIAGTQLFVYGQRVNDFHRVRKETVWTVATAALQEVDRQLQAEKAKVTTLESQLASVLTRLDALENA